ncbi:hypothetical protein BDK51DRAFT_42921 [Blyttiomyces helicus]|uniref:Uncharacterized protein n=1 Tax=Blyttiomyces helicus TaxID=388810 RepID=A0A4P9WN63_9FUNG|nr:hypothetical protein BDK51DRAFT_42921 [Blyttiomyces helicus]|eukprot:RKO94364.1 hypothetical protein BDK51DRAFT_42921 [Blyttiomyces helicus]
MTNYFWDMLFYFFVQNVCQVVIKKCTPRIQSTDPTSSWKWSVPTATTSAPAGMFNSAEQTLSNFEHSEMVPAPSAPAGSLTFANQYLYGICVGTATDGWATTSYTKVPVNLTAGNNLFSVVDPKASGHAELFASLMSSNNSVLLHMDSTWTSTPAPVQSTGTQVFNPGNFGMCLWGSASNFAHTTLYWIGNTSTAVKNAPAGGMTGRNISTTTAGWAKTSYTELPVNLTPGANMISIVAINADRPATPTFLSLPCPNCNNAVSQNHQTINKRVHNLYQWLQDALDYARKFRLPSSTTTTCAEQTSKTFTTSPINSEIEHMKENLLGADNDLGGLCNSHGSLKCTFKGFDEKANDDRAKYRAWFQQLYNSMQQRFAEIIQLIAHIETRNAILGENFANPVDGNLPHLAANNIIQDV